MNLTDADWYLGRGTGVVALVMFTLSLVLGICTRSGRRAVGLDRFGVADLHRTAALVGTGLVVVHVTTQGVVAVSRLHVDWTRCDGHGLCADLVPEVLTRDEWGYPLARDAGNRALAVPAPVLEHARRAADMCPLLALSLVP
jgi:ferredoxin